MALNYTNPTSGEVVCTDLDDDGEHVQLVKLATGAIGEETTRVSSANPLPVVAMNASGAGVALPTFSAADASFATTVTTIGTGNVALAMFQNRNGSAGTKILRLRRVLLRGIARVAGSIAVLLARGNAAAPILDGTNKMSVPADSVDGMSAEGMMSTIPNYRAAVDVLTANLFRAEIDANPFGDRPLYADEGVAKPITIRPGEFLQVGAFADVPIDLQFTLTMEWTEEPAA